MKKILLGLVMLIGVASATNVATCRFSDGANGFTNNLIICSEDMNIKDMTTIKEMYAKGWKYKGSYNVENYTYIVFEK